MGWFILKHIFSTILSIINITRLHLLLDDHLISRYTHLIYLVSESEASAQVLDLLFGVLNQIAAACKIPAAAILANQMERIIQMEKLGINPPTSCFVLLWFLLGGSPLGWRYELSLLAANFTVVAHALQADQNPECQ